MVSRQQTGFHLGVTVGFLALCVLGLAYHELWRDEAYSLLLLEASTSFGDLVDRMGFVGHPKGRNLVLYGLTRVFDAQWVLWVTNTAFMAAAVFLFLRHAPFTRLQKVLFPLGFFPLFQYGIISRSYSLVVLLVFAWCWLRTRPRRRPVVVGLILALLASVHVLSFLFALVFVAVEALDQWMLRREKPGAGEWIGLALVGSSLAVTLWQLLPPAGTPVVSFVHPERWYFLQTLANGFLPNFDGLNTLPTFQRIAGLALWVPTWFCFRGSRLGLALYGLGTLVLLAFVIGIHPGHRWHHGFYFVLFVSALWVGFHDRGLRNRFATGFVTVLFGIHAAVGVWALARDVAGPCSSGEPAAAWIEDNGLADLARVGVKVHKDGDRIQRPFKFEIDEIQSTLVHLDDRRIYDPVAGRFEVHWTHYSDPGYYPWQTPGDLMDGLGEVSRALESDLLVIVVRPYGRETVDLPPGLEKLRDFPNGLFYGESISLYRFGRASADRSRPTTGAPRSGGLRTLPAPTGCRSRNPAAYGGLPRTPGPGRS